MGRARCQSPWVSSSPLLLTCSLALGEFPCPRPPCLPQGRGRCEQMIHVGKACGVQDLCRVALRRNISLSLMRSCLNSASGMTECTWLQCLSYACGRLSTSHIPITNDPADASSPFVLPQCRPLPQGTMPEAPAFTQNFSFVLKLREKPCILAACVCS